MSLILVKMRGGLIKGSMTPPAPVICAGVPSAAVQIPKLHETWSGQVQSSNAEVVVAKEQKEFGPTIVIRVDTFRPLKKGGTIIACRRKLR